MSELSEYEQQRLAHIKRNHEMLVRLGLADDPLMTPQPKKERKPRTKPPPALPETLRRSSRVRNVDPEYTKETIDTFGEELDRQCEPGAARKRQKVEAEEDEDEERVREEIAASTASFLRAAREAMARFITSEDGDAPLNADGWRDEAVRRWGELAGGGPAAGRRDWEAYVTSRLSRPPPPSADPLLQEFYAADMWQLLCVCVLMSRVSSWETKHRCISAFFAAHPTPSAFMASVITAGETAPLRALINSLGLFDDRLKSLTAITTAFLLPENGDAFAVDLKAHKIRGIGEFGYHSWLIFCCDLGDTVRPSDKCLASYCAWRKKQPARVDDAVEEVAVTTSTGIKVD